MRSIGVGLVTMALVVLLLPASGQPTTGDTLAIVKEDTLPSNVEIAVAIAEETFEQASQVVVSRDDEFADALASGLLQADGPLLLVPSQGPIPASVEAQLDALAPDRAIVLGGEAAVSQAVEDELASREMDVERRQGLSRFETAIDIASRDAPAADTVLLARAFGANPADPSQGFADALAAGGLAARDGHPILLSQTDELTAPTREYLQATPAIRRVLILGGTAAISQAVQDELVGMGLQVERVAGPSRADTAIEIAKVGGDQTAADAERIVVTDGQADNAWAAGFALASHAATFDAPIVLTTGQTVPPATESFLESGIGGEDVDEGVRLTCAVLPDVCETVRVTAQLPPAPQAFLPGLDRGPWGVAGASVGQDQVVGTFEGAADEHVRVGFDQGSSIDGFHDVVLVGPEGVEVEALTIFPSSGEVDVGDIVVLPRTGSYDVVFRPRDDDDQSLRLFVSGVRRIEDGIEIDGDPVEVDIDRLGRTVQVPMQGEIGQEVRFAWDGVTSVDDILSVDLISPLGTRTFGVLSDVFEDPRVSGTYVLEEDGTYLLEVYAYDDPAVSLRLHAVSPVLLEEEVVVDGPSVTIPVERLGQVVRAPFTAQAGDTVQFGWENGQGVDEITRVYLLHPSGRVEQVLADLGGEEALGDPFTIEESGEFLLEVRPGTDAFASLDLFARSA